MNAIQAHALSLAAHNHVALGSTALEALEVFMQLKAMSEDDKTRDLRICEVKFVGNASEDDEGLVHEMVSMIEHDAQSLIDFGKSLLNAAHLGLIDAAIDGSLDSDATTWNLYSLAEINLEPQSD